MRVFVSHAGRDRAWAEWVGWQLEHAGLGITVELDYWDWQAGDSFITKMNTALETSDRMLALFSQAYFEPARWTHPEWTAAFRMAMDRPGFLVPVRLDDTPAPPLLGPLLSPALHGLPREQARTELLNALHPPGRPDREPPMPGQPAPERQDGEPRLPGVLPPVWGEVPGRNEAFTGRDRMLADLRQALHHSGRSVVHALHGAGGVGKTQLATEYAWRFAGNYDAVWWINAEQTDRIGEQYATLAAALHLINPTTPISAAVDALRAWCRSRSGWLIVLDNATTAHDIHPWLLAGPGHVLITSRDHHWPEIAATVEVDVFARPESITLLRTHLPALPEPDADHLAHALGDLPLALAQAAGVLAETAMPATEYLDLLTTTPGEVLNEGHPISYPQSLARSVRIAVDKLTDADPAAAQLLQLCGFLAPEPIPTTWFPTTADMLPEPLATTTTAPLAYRRALGLLARYGLAKLTNNHLTVHRLTQTLLRTDTPDPHHTTTTIGHVLAGQNPGDTRDPRTWPAWADLLPHLQTLDLTTTTTTDDRLAWQACEASNYLLSRGEYQAGHDLIHPLHTAWHDTAGPTAKRTLWAGNYLAQSLGYLGRHHEAITIERHRYDHHRTTNGDDHPDTLTAAGNFANRLAALGHHEQARDLDQDTLDRRRRLLGDDHPNTLNSANNLAIQLAALGHHEQAHDLDQDTLERYRRLLGDDHPDTLHSANSLAIRLAALGHHEQAHDLHQDTLDRYRRTLGDNHPDTLHSANNLAIDLGVLGEADAAARLRHEFSLDDPAQRSAPDFGEP